MLATIAKHFANSPAGEFASGCLAVVLKDVNLTSNKLYPPGPGESDPLTRISISPETSHLIIVGKRIGYGGSCDVYGGLYAPTGQRLALKRLRYGGSQAERRFRREAKIWSALIHVNILPFYGLHDISSDTHPVSPWIESGDLSAFLDGRLSYFEKGQLPASDSIRAALKRPLWYENNPVDLIHFVNDHALSLRFVALLLGWPTSMREA
ncbi:hypothetical protein FRB94_004184 [Tulasnella sp. JGI-2019a]|nr:hypothetical protein FRB94_004184 [Tulasnella sp. JGI-2019a]